MLIESVASPPFIPGEAPPSIFTIGSAGIHVWQASLDHLASRVDEYSQTLSPAERKRATKYLFLRDTYRWTVHRGLLRRILGSYVAIEPERLTFCYNVHGKPCLSPNCNPIDLQFSVSQSRGLGLYALTIGRRVGIDVEAASDSFATIENAERFFSSYEVSVLLSLPAGLQTRAFFNCWTRKEAYLKAKGEPVFRRVKSIDVTLAPGDPPALLRTSADLQEVSRWSIEALEPAPGYIAALAVEGHDLNITCFAWPFED